MSEDMTFSDLVDRWFADLILRFPHWKQEKDEYRQHYSYNSDTNAYGTTEGWALRVYRLRRPMGWNRIPAITVYDEPPKIVISREQDTWVLYAGDPQLFEKIFTWVEELEKGDTLKIWEAAFNKKILANRSKK